MMHISPCAWYCFDIGEAVAWNLKDLPDKTVINAQDNSCTIELIAARKIKKAEDVEISDFHESYLTEEKIQPMKTVMTENPYKIITIVTRGIGPDERYWIVCHAFWNNYCAFIRYHGHRQEGMEPKVQAFYDIVNSLQPLAMD
jgi:hypothetical protein